MTHSNQQRAIRCRQIIAFYSDNDPYTNLVDFLADAIHFCRVHGHSFINALETAVVHFDAEIGGDGPQDELGPRPTDESKSSTAATTTAQSSAPLTDAALDAFWHVVVERFPQAETGDLSPWTTVRLHQAALDAIQEWIWANVPQFNNQ